MKATFAITIATLCLLSLSANSQALYKDSWRELRFSSWFQSCLSVAQQEYLTLFRYIENTVTLPPFDDDDVEEQENTETTIEVDP